jgi:hypothetical protein
MWDDKQNIGGSGKEIDKVKFYKVVAISTLLFMEVELWIRRSKVCVWGGGGGVLEARQISKRLSEIDGRKDQPFTQG